MNGSPAFIVLGLTTIWQPNPAIREPLPQGPFGVQVLESWKLRDSPRNREVDCKVYYPEAGRQHPVIVFSHGFGGHKDSFGEIARHWASHGYVVIHPSHQDGLRQDGLRRQDALGRQDRPGRKLEPMSTDPTNPLPRRSGGLLAALNNPPAIEQRVADLRLILDELHKLSEAAPALTGRFSREQIGVAGHSFGAYTAMLTGGVTVDLGNQPNRSFRDPRVKCILPISAQGTGQQGLTRQSWNNLTIPMMTITGTLDRGAQGQGWEWKKEPYQFAPAGDKYLVVIDGANHVAFGGALGRRGEEITRIVKLTSTHFWNAYLKNDQQSKEWLQSGQLKEAVGGKSTLELK